MKKQIAVLLAAAALVLPMVGSAQGTTTSYKSGHQNLAGLLVYNSCNGSVVTINSGWFDYNYSYTVSGSQVKGSSNYSASGKGTGPSYGYYGLSNYSFKNSFSSKFAYSLTSLAQSYTSTGGIKLDQKGPKGQTMLLQFDYVLQISPSGNIVQSINNYRFTCQ